MNNKFFSGMLLAAIVVSISNASEGDVKVGYVQTLKNGVSSVFNIAKNAGRVSCDVIVNDIAKKSVSSWRNGALTLVSASAVCSATDALTSRYTPRHVWKNRFAKAAATVGVVYVALKYFGTK